MIYKCFLLLIIGLLTPVYAENSPQGQEVKIVADSIECDQTAGMCVAMGNAFVEKLNDPQRKTITANKINVLFEKTKTDVTPQEKDTKREKSNQKPKEFKAYENVVVVLGDSIIRGDRAIYNPDTEVIEFFENVSVTSGKNHIIGDYGRADLSAGVYKVLNSKDRVQAMIYKSDGHKTKGN